MQSQVCKPIVYIVDDDEGVRKSLHWLLGSVGLDCQLFASAMEFLSIFDNNLRGCLVLDIRMPGMSGLDLQRHLNAEGSNLPLIIVTGHADVPVALQAMKSGAFDLIEKPYSDQLLLERIQAAMELDSKQRDILQNNHLIKQRLAKLTPREYEVMICVIDGCQNKEVASQLDISIKTVEVHRSNFMKKLQVRTLPELVRMVMSVRDPSV